MNALRENDLGQVLILAVNELRWDPALERLLQSLRPGGILIDAPLAGAAQRGAEFLSKAAGAVAALPLLAIREEGGDMDPLRALLPSLPSPRSVAEKGLAAVRRLGDLVGSALHLFGFNTDLAPLLDLAMPDPGRVFSSEPAQMAKLGTAWLEASNLTAYSLVESTSRAWQERDAPATRSGSWSPSPWPSCGAKISSLSGRSCRAFPCFC